MRIFHPVKAFQNKQNRPDIQEAPADAILAEPLPLHSTYLARLLENARICASTEKPVILCIGTDRIIGDSLGPLTGSLLEKCARASFFVYGTLASTVHACNLEKTLRQKKKSIHTVQSSLWMLLLVRKIKSGLYLSTPAA